MKQSLGSIALLTLLTACAANLGELPATHISDAHGAGSVVQFNQNSTLIASGGLGGSIRIWRVPDGGAVSSFQGHHDQVHGMAFIDDGQLVSAAYDGRIIRWDRQGKILSEVHSSPVMHMIADEQNSFIMTGHNDGAVRLWRLPDLELMEERRLHEGDVIAVAWDASSGRFASSGNDGRVFVWTKDAQPIELHPPPTDAGTLTFSPDGQMLTGGSWFNIFHWDLASGVLKVVPTEHRGFIKRLHCSGDGKTLASISAEFDSSVYLLEPLSGAVIRRFRAHGLCGEDITFSPDNHYLATTSDDASVRLWDLRAPTLRSNSFDKQ
jgi:WD40 repeat protein